MRVPKYEHTYWVKFYFYNYFTEGYEGFVFTWYLREISVAYTILSHTYVKVTYKNKY